MFYDWFLKDYKMLETTISYLAWTVVVLIQAIVHFWILSGTRRGEDAALLRVPSGNNNTGTSNDGDKKIDSERNHDELTGNDGVPSMVPHLQVSEDEAEEDQESESFDGDEPQLFFDLLGKTGLEMMKSCSSLENLVQEQLTKADTLIESTRLDNTMTEPIG